MYDVIGDVHGEDGKLRALLRELGYAETQGAWRHPQARQAIFVGDLIDRGAGQREVLQLVRDMEQAGSARVVLGNHEYNAIGYATPGPGGSSYLRSHSAKNQGQHRAFLEQFGWLSAEHLDAVNWFRTLPVALDLGGIRVCHAWWDDAKVRVAAEAAAGDGGLNEDFLHASFDETDPAFEVVKGITQGHEIKLPEGFSFHDHGGNVRDLVRVRWWDATVTTFRDAALLPEPERPKLPEVPLPEGTKLGNASPVPVFVGHYWLTRRPGRQNVNTAVLDYSAAKGGPLVAYRWEGETELTDAHFVGVGG